MHSKKIFLLLTFSVSCLYTHQVKLVKVINRSYDNAVLTYLPHNFTIKTGKTKQLLLDIPFTSRQKNLIDFVQDRPYVPAQALKIVTTQGTFFLWCDERGLITAKAFERGMSRLEALPNVCLPLSAQDLNRVLAFILTIQHNGSLSIS